MSPRRGRLLARVTLTAIPGVPDVRPGADLAALIVHALRSAGLRPAAGDALVVAQKVVSKAEGSVVDLATVTPGPAAARLAETLERDPRLVEVVLGESTRVVRAEHGVLITEHRLGFICANAGVDHSNVGLGPDTVSLLPRNPDASARVMRDALRTAFGVPVAVVINDSHGRPHRAGAVGVCIGAAGLEPVVSLVGRPDLYGYTLRTSTEAIADELAAAATLLQGQCAEAVPAVLVQGLAVADGPGGAAQLLRDPAHDLFR
ncbi:MAG TPA: coenzyme F420-0:L-glutamate ligase [bacterium]|nr:coenzyme F420-0:L-glutamate ligase [bacterium]